MKRIHVDRLTATDRDLEGYLAEMVISHPGGLGRRLVTVQQLSANGDPAGLRASVSGEISAIRDWLVISEDPLVHLVKVRG